MPTQDYAALAAELDALLRPATPPLAITFSGDPLPAVPRFEAPMPPPTADGRTGRVAAGCVFWMKATHRTFATVPEDHGNCSVGSLTHGLKSLDQVAGNADVAALLDAGWVSMDMVPRIPVVKERSNFITYGPLREATVDPDVVLLRLNGKQTMILHDAVPELRFEGKPQCHIIAIAKELDQVAVSVGCMLSRVRTGMSSNEMTVAIPGRRLGEVVARLGRTCAADNQVAVYASEDSRRFPT